MAEPSDLVSGAFSSARVHVTRCSRHGPNLHTRVVVLWITAEDFATAVRASLPADCAMTCLPAVEPDHILLAILPFNVLQVSACGWLLICADARMAYQLASCLQPAIAGTLL
jgi:hypothetical protein